MSTTISVTKIILTSIMQWRAVVRLHKDSAKIERLKVKP